MHSILLITEATSVEKNKKKFRTLYFSPEHKGKRIIISAEKINYQDYIWKHKKEIQFDIEINCIRLNAIYSILQNWKTFEKKYSRE